MRHFCLLPALSLLPAAFPHPLAAASDPKLRLRLLEIQQAINADRRVVAKRIAFELAARGDGTLKEVLEIALDHKSYPRQGPPAAASEWSSVKFGAQWVLPVLAAGREERILPVLNEAIREPTRYGAVDAVQILGNLADRRAAPALEKLLVSLRDKPAAHRDQRRNLQASVAASLGKIGEPGSVRWVRETLLKDPDYMVRYFAVQDALGPIGGPEAREALAEARKDPHEEVRKAAAAALASMEDGYPFNRQGWFDRVVAMAGCYWRGSAIGNLQAIRDQAREVRNIIEQMADASFRPAPLAFLSLIKPEESHRGPASEVRLNVLKFVDKKFLLPLEGAWERPFLARQALENLLSGVYDHADGTRGGFPEDDIIFQASDQERLQAAIVRLVSLYPAKYAISGELGPGGGKMNLATGSNIYVPPGALPTPVTLLIVGPHEDDQREVWGLFPSGLKFSKPAALSLVHRDRDPPHMALFYSGGEREKILGTTTRHEIDGFW